MNLGELNATHLGKRITVHCPVEPHQGVLDYVGHDDAGYTELHLTDAVMSFAGSEPSAVEVEVQS